MLNLTRLGTASALAFCLAGLPAEGQGNDVAFDFKMSGTNMTGTTEKKGESTGHAIMSKGRMRLEMSGNSPMGNIPGLAQGEPITLILPDTGRTFIILQPTKHQYMTINPSAMMEGMQKMMESMGATMTFEITGDDPKVENLGSGPDILGHHTSHWRTTSITKVKVGAMGQTQQTEATTVVDQYIAPDVKNLDDPFRGLQRNPMADMFGSGAKEYLEKMQAARKKLPSGSPLRTEQSVKIISAGRESSGTSVSEVTKISNVRATDDMFKVPPDYTMVKMPMPGGPPPG
ncbi:MAG TPA: DUF4412 domain-containing protein [Nitrospira sp.]